MNLPRRVYIAIRIVIPLLILAAGGFGYVKLKELRKPPARSKPDPGLPLVETEPARKHTGELTIHLDGTVVPYREIVLSSEVEGRVVSKGAAAGSDGTDSGNRESDDTEPGNTESNDVRAGQFVTKGQVLIQINSEDYQLEVSRQIERHAQAEASINETKAEIMNGQAQEKLLNEDFKRSVADLARVRILRAQGAALETDQDNAEQNHRAAESAHTKEKNNLKLLQARLTRLMSARDLAATEQQKAEIDLTRCTIKAPCDGVIVEDHVERDAFVQRGAMLLKVQDTTATEVRTSLRVDDVYWLWQHHSAGESASENRGNDRRSAWEIPDVPVTVMYELNGATFSWQGQLSRHEGSGLDVQTRTVPCRVLVSNPTSASRMKVDEVVATPPPALLRGMFVSVQLHTNPQEELISVPEKAIRPGSVIWKVADGKLQRLVVRVARVYDGRALIHASGSHLSDGDAVVTSQLSTETSGMAVRTESDRKSDTKVKAGSRTSGPPTGTAR